jgi:hypothetical protein
VDVPEDLLAAVEELLAGDLRGAQIAAADPRVVARLRVAVESWLHGSMTSEQAIGVLRVDTSSGRR